jgi:hypothetical protein
VSKTKREYTDDEIDCLRILKEIEAFKYPKTGSHRQIEAMINMGFIEEVAFKKWVITQEGMKFLSHLKGEV